MNWRTSLDDLGVTAAIIATWQVWATNAELVVKLATGVAGLIYMILRCRNAYKKTR